MNTAAYYYVTYLTLYSGSEVELLTQITDAGDHDSKCWLLTLVSIGLTHLHSRTSSAASGGAILYIPVLIFHVKEVFQYFQVILSFVHCVYGSVCHWFPKFFWVQVKVCKSLSLSDRGSNFTGEVLVEGGTLSGSERKPFAQVLSFFLIRTFRLAALLISSPTTSTSRKFQVAFHKNMFCYHTGVSFTCEMNGVVMSDMYKHWIQMCPYFDRAMFEIVRWCPHPPLVRMFVLTISRPSSNMGHVG